MEGTDSFATQRQVQEQWPVSEIVLFSEVLQSVKCIGVTVLFLFFSSQFVFLFFHINFVYRVLSDSKYKLKNNADYLTFFYQQSQVLLFVAVVVFCFCGIFLFFVHTLLFGVVLHFLHIHACKILYQCML